LEQTPKCVEKLLKKVESTPLRSEETGSLKLNARKKNRVVLDEDEFTQKLETIIQRDFFPEIPRLVAQNEYLKAQEQNDVEKIRQLQMKYSMSRQRVTRDTDALSRSAWTTPMARKHNGTPLSFDTPDEAQLKKEGTAHERSQGVSQESDCDVSDEVADLGLPTAASNNNNSPRRSNIAQDQHEEDLSFTASKKKEDTLKLDQFLANFSSEDNASFEELMSEEDRRRRIRHAWMYEAARRHARCYLPGAPRQLALAERHDDATADEEPKPKVLDNWTYRVRNDVLWVPEGAELTTEERIKRAKMSQRVVVHENTRLHGNPFLSSSEHAATVYKGPGQRSTAGRPQQDSMSRAVGVQAVLHKGKMTAQGAPVFGDPQNDLLGPLVTPSPVPGMFGDETPMMTWGEIEGTPFRLDGGDTPLLAGSGPSFKVPEVPKRDQLALSLVENASRQHRQRKKKAMMQISAAFVSPKIGAASSSMERLNSMSPAARRLATSKLGIRLGTDKALKAAYSTPVRSAIRKSPRQGTRTPVRSASSSLATPTSTGQSKIGAGSPNGSYVGKVTSSGEVIRDKSAVTGDGDSLTDNLLLGLKGRKGGGGELDERGEKRSAAEAEGLVTREAADQRRCKAEDFF
jgi:protein DGCR14